MLVLVLLGMVGGVTSSATASNRGGIRPVPAATLAENLSDVARARLINFYPANRGWTFMWTNWDPQQINADLARAARLGATAVRVCAFPETFGFPRPHAPYSQRLADFMTMAAAHGMSVKLTLFDWWAGYSDINGSVTWVKALLAPYVNDGRLLTIELKNEMDPRDAAAMAWARALIPAVRQVLPNIPITISLPGTMGTAGLRALKSQLAATPLDYYDYHFYSASERAHSVLSEARSIAAPRPLVIGEAGLSTAQATESEQAAYLARVFIAARGLGGLAVAPWTLNDYSGAGIPPQAGYAPGSGEYHFGLYHVDGTAKASASVVEQAWAGRTPSASQLLNLGFEEGGLAPWVPFQTSLGVGAKTTTDAHSGTSSVAFTGTRGGADRMPSVKLSPLDPVLPGSSWSVSAWARGKEATGINELALAWFDASGNYVGQTTSELLPVGDTEWTQLTARGAALGGAVAVEIHLKSAANRGTVWFDDVTVTHS